MAPHSTHGGKIVERDRPYAGEVARGDPAGDTPTHLPLVPTVDGPLCVKAPYADEVAVVVLRGSPQVRVVWYDLSFVGFVPLPRRTLPHPAVTGGSTSRV